MGAYFPHGRILEIRGQRSRYRRSSDSARPAEAYFCPVCGTTVYWQLEPFPDKYGVAVGCFSDPTFPRPSIAAWSATKHDWVELPSGCRVLDAQS